MHTWLTPRALVARPAAGGGDGLSLEPALPPALQPLQPTTNPMAHFVKWCKARFLHGYKQFSVLQQDSNDGRSDTEELLRAGQPPPQDSRAPSPAPSSPAPPPASVRDKERERTPSQERAARRERLPSPERPGRVKEQDKQAGDQNTTQPQPQPQPSPTNRHLNFEEFECDVSVEGGVDEAGQERQEFSFTLYDFDGHGKITKDDITGLVSTIYDTLGASIKVPHYGSKTIKVKLTVSPDKRAAMGSSDANGTSNPTYVNGVPPVAEHADDEPQTTPPTRVRFKRDLNVTIQERRPPRPRRTSSASVRRRPSAASTPAPAPAPAPAPVSAPPPPPPPQREREPSEDRGYVVHSCSSSCRSGAGSEGGDVEVDGSADEDDIEDEDDDGGRTCPATGLSPASVAAAAVASVAANVAANGCHSPHVKKRSSSMQRQELLQIIQANMEKMAKKSCSERTGLEERRHSHSGVHPHRHRHRQKKAAPPMSLSASNSPQRIYDYATTPYYVNLADKGENAPGDADTYRYVVCTPKHQPMYHNVPCRDRGHNRSRSHDLTTTNTHNHNHAHQHSHNHSHSHNPAAPLFRYTLLQEDNTSSVQAFNVRPAKSPAANRRTRLPPTAAGHTSSPHHLKHRNREQDQARAMAQVVQWLEQEFSASLNTRTTAGVQEVLINAKAHRTKSKSFTSPTEPAPAPSATTHPGPNISSNTPQSTPHEEEPAPSAGDVKQHEHHHVHEHIHHHYHHYQETPPVLV